MSNQSKGSSFVNFIPGILMMVAAFVVIYYVTTGIYAVLSYIAIGLFVAAAIIDYRVILNYGKMLINMIKRNPIAGLAVTGLSVFFYPLVGVFLFGKALLLRKVRQFTEKLDPEFQQRQQQQRAEDEFVDYEEVEDIRPERSKPIELPPIKEKSKQTPPQTDYDDLFE